MSVNKFSNDADKNSVMLRELSKQAVELGLRFSVTTNYENVERFGASIYRRCSLVSLSYDEFKFRNHSRLSDLLYAVLALRDYVPTVNINLLLTERLMNDVKRGLLDTFLRCADSIYLLLPKGYHSDFTRHQFSEFVDWLVPLLNDFEVFKRVSLDNCVKPFIHPFSTAYTHCERGSEVVAVGPGGEIAFSVFDPPYAVLEHASQFRVVLEEMFGSNGGLRRSEGAKLCDASSFCPFIQFTDSTNPPSN